MSEFDEIVRGLATFVAISRIHYKKKTLVVRVDRIEINVDALSSNLYLFLVASKHNLSSTKTEYFELNGLLDAAVRNFAWNEMPLRSDFI